MANPTIDIGIINQSSVATQTQIGKLLFTDEGKQYIVKSDGSKLKFTDMLFVSVLPTTGLTEILYILTTDNSINYYDTTWKTAGGKSQIEKVNTLPTVSIDTNKLYLLSTDNSINVYDGITWAKYGGNTISNIGTGARVYSQTVNNDAKLRTIKAGTNCTVSESVDSITVSANITGNANGFIDYGTSTSSAFNYDNTKIEFDVTNVKLKANDTIDSYTKLLMHMDVSNFKDEIGNTVTYTNVSLSNASPALGTGWAYFNGTSSYQSVANSTDWDFGSDDFTIDMRIKPMALGTSNVLLLDPRSVAAAKRFVMYIDLNGKLVFAMSTGSTFSSLMSSITLVMGTNYHIAVVRNGTTITMYINGISVGTMPFIGSMNTDTAPITIGKHRDSTTGSYYKGYIDELRISRGIARWTSNFTPPNYIYGTNYDTTQYNTVTLKSTQLLDASTYYQINGITITDNMPTNTDIKYALDIGTAYPKVWNGSAFVDCTDIATNGMTKTSLQTALTNYSWNSLGSKFGIVCALKSSDASITPTIDNIAINYLASPNILAGHVITDGTTSFNQRANLKFVGASITDDLATNSTLVTITGGSVDMNTLPTF